MKSKDDIVKVQRVADKLLQNISKVIVGKQSAIEECLWALFCQGHILAEDVPGVGKTMLARALAKSLGLTFKRIQFTPDLLPSDVIGVTIFDQKEQTFSFRPGPIFANIVLADEINRGTPRTQAALLESMEERQVTVDGDLQPLNDQFIVIATQNPIEFEGTFPLPEAQLDRFFARISLGYPDASSEVMMLERLSIQHPIDSIGQVVDLEELNDVQRIVREVHVEGNVSEYIVQLVRETRNHPDVTLGVSPRGTLALYRAAQAMAAFQGREYVLPDDVKRVARSVMTHRILLKPESLMRGKTSDGVIDDVLDHTPLVLSAATKP